MGLNKSFSYQAAELLELRGENSLLLMNFNQVAFSLTQGSNQLHQLQFQIFVQVCLPLAFDELETHVLARQESLFQPRFFIGLCNLAHNVSGVALVFPIPGTHCSALASRL